MGRIPWYKASFNEAYDSMYRHALTNEYTETETREIVRILGLPQGARILDLCCGSGRHVVELARHGYAVTGFDLSGLQLAKARAHAEDSKVKVRLVQGNMRALPFTDEFDAVINMFNSFGYLESDEGDQKVLGEVARVLRAGGLFLQQIPNREGVIRTFQPMRAMWLPDGSLGIDERNISLSDSRLHCRQTLIEVNGARSVIDLHQRLYSLTEIVRMLVMAGLSLNWHAGGLRGNALDLDSTYSVLLATKPGRQG